MRNIQTAQQNKRLQQRTLSSVTASHLNRELDNKRKNSGRDGVDGIVLPKVLNLSASFHDAQVHATNERSATQSPALEIATNNIDDSTKELLESTLRPLSPSSIVKLIPGYSGYYKGKVVPIVGRAEFPVLISSLTSDSNTSISAFSDRFKRPKTANAPLTYSPPEHMKLIVRDIQDRINERFYTYAEKRLHVKHIFQLYDRQQSGSVSMTDFKVCLNKINAAITSRDLQLIAQTYRGSNAGEVAYLKFVEDICGPGVVDHHM